jgi:type IV secretory pathway VirB4 component
MIFEVLENAGIDFESLSDDELQIAANEAYEILDELSTKTLAKAASAASDPDSDYHYGKSHDPQKFADHAKKTKDAKSAAAVQGAADAKGHYTRPGHTIGSYDKLAHRTPARVTSAGKANKQDVNRLKSNIQRNEATEQDIYVIDADLANGVNQANIEERMMTEPEKQKKEEMVKSMKKGLAGFKERYGDRAKNVMYATATKNAMKD